MKFTKLLDWVIKPAVSEVNYYGSYSGFTMENFYTKKMNIKKIINTNDYFNSTTSPSTTDFDVFYASYYSESNKYREGWHSPIIICALDNDGHFWSFDSFYNNVVDWTVEGPLTIPETESEITTFLAAWTSY
jgi:hypothetical protein